jgi:hypothetical protein
MKSPLWIALMLIGLISQPIGVFAGPYPDTVMDASVADSKLIPRRPAPAPTPWAGMAKCKLLSNVVNCRTGPGKAHPVWLQLKGTKKKYEFYCREKEIGCRKGNW